MGTLPASGYLSNAARLNSELKTGVEAVRDFVAQLGGGSAETTLTISSGSVTPTVAVHAIDTEASAASDDLTNIVQTNLPDGSFLFVHSANAGRDVVLKHAAGGSGQLSMVDGADLELEDPSMWVFFKRTGSLWQELFRSYGNQSAAAASALGLGTVAFEDTPLPVNVGGTGATSASAARTNLGLGTLAVLNSPLPIANGGTGATTAAAALTALLPSQTGNEGKLLASISGAGTWVDAGTGSVFFGTGTDGNVTLEGGGTVVLNGIKHYTTLQVGGASATVLTHDIGRALHVKAQAQIILAANGTINVDGKGGAGGASSGSSAGADGTRGMAGAGGGGNRAADLTTTGGAGGSTPLAAGGAGGGASPVAGGAAQAWPADVGFIASAPLGPGAGGGAAGNGAGDSTTRTGGAGGGFVILEAPAIVYTSGFAITARGANGTAGGGGGGGGTVVVRRRLATGTFAATVTGGTGGANGGAGLAFEEILR